MFEQDYMMRLIHEVVRTLLKLLFNIDNKKTETVDFEDDEIGEKYNDLLNLVDAGMINEAENTLMDQLDLSKMNSFEMALMFYSYLNEKDDDFLEQCNFFRYEIADGIKYICGQYGYKDFGELFINLF